jgi:hypothetical protein
MTAQSQARIQELEQEVCNLRESLDEKNESYKQALETIEVYENKEVSLHFRSLSRLRLSPRDDE